MGRETRARQADVLHLEGARLVSRIHSVYSVSFLKSKFLSFSGGLLFINVWWMTFVNWR
ncbi:hypothetical protein BDW62DRAFT_57989 [Aspergillus aurantiobrunneus]